MKEAPLQEKPMDKRHHDLGVAILGNISQVNIPLEDAEYFLRNKDQIPGALRQGFVRPRLFGAKEVGIRNELRIAQGYAQDYLNWQGDTLEEMFIVPELFPWESVTAVFIPRGLSPKGAIQVLKEFVPVECRPDISGLSESPRDQLFFVAGQIAGDQVTKGRTPIQLRHSACRYLDLTGLLVAVGTNKLGHLEKGLRDFLNPSLLIYAPDSVLPDGKTVAIAGMLEPNGVNITAHGPNFAHRHSGAVLALEAKRRT
jgi:hypothetical protein